MQTYSCVTKYYLLSSYHIPITTRVQIRESVVSRGLRGRYVGTKPWGWEPNPRYHQPTCRSEALKNCGGLLEAQKLRFGDGGPSNYRIDCDGWRRSVPLWAILGPLGSSRTLTNDLPYNQQVNSGWLCRNIITYYRFVFVSSNGRCINIGESRSIV